MTGVFTDQKWQDPKPLCDRAVLKGKETHDEALTGRSWNESVLSSQVAWESVFEVLTQFQHCHGKIIKAWFGHCWAIFIEICLKRDLQYGDGIILLYGVLVKSKFDGFKS